MCAIMQTRIVAHFTNTAEANSKVKKTICSTLELPTPNVVYITTSKNIKYMHLKFCTWHWCRMWYTNPLRHFTAECSHFHRRRLQPVTAANQSEHIYTASDAARQSQAHSCREFMSSSHLVYFNMNTVLTTLKITDSEQ